MRPDLIEEIKSQVRLTDYTGLVDGAYVVCPSVECPSRLRGEKKCRVSTDSWRCFRCDAFGDVLDWRSLRERVPLGRAVSAFAEELGLGQLSCPERSRMLEAYVAACHRHLMATLDKNDYLVSARGIDVDVLRRYQVGYADPENKVLRDSGLSNAELLQLGLIKINGENADAKTARAWFSGHYVFPYRTVDGDVLQIKGRLDPALRSDPRAPKSLALLSKAEHAPADWKPIGPHQILFGEQFVGDSKKSLLIAEGEVDVLTAAGWGLTAVGISGGKLGVRPRRLIQDCGLDVYDARDQDQASEPKFLDDAYQLLMAQPQRKLFRVRWPALSGYDESGQAVKVDVNDLAVKHGWNRADFLGAVRTAVEAKTEVIRHLATEYRRGEKFERLSKLYRRQERSLRPRFLDLVHAQTGVPKDLMAFGLDPSGWKPETTKVEKKQPQAPEPVTLFPKRTGG